MRKHKLSRRSFVKNSASAAAAVAAGPYVLLGAANDSPNEKLNIACIGVGVRGGYLAQKFASEKMKQRYGPLEIVALCDVNDQRAAGAFKAFPEVPRFRDYRKMFDKLDKQIDAVIVATTDHAHFPVSMRAIEMGKHVFVEKPMAHSVEECRRLTEAARKHKIATQMGNMGHSSGNTFMIREWIDAGAIGEVRRVDCWNSTVWSASESPKPVPAPESLSWDLWLGTAAFRPYSPAYVGNFYPWVDFGTGVFGGWGTHTLDASFWGLQLGAPTSVEAKATSGHIKETFPRGTAVEFHYPARGNMPPVTVTYYIGEMSSDMPWPEHLEADRELATNGGQLIIGTDASILAGRYGESCRIVPETKMQQVGKPPKKYERPSGDHFGSWLLACKGGKPAASNFDYAGPFTEMCLLGVIASLCPGRKLLWDSAKMRITNDEEADKLVRRQYRKGWEI